MDAHEDKKQVYYTKGKEKFAKPVLLSKNGGTHPVIAIDSKCNLFAVWEYSEKKEKLMYACKFDEKGHVSSFWDMTDQAFPAISGCKDSVFCAWEYKDKEKRKIYFMAISPSKQSDK